MSDTGHFQFKRALPLPPTRIWHLLTDAKARQLWGAPSDEDVLEVDASDLSEDGLDIHRCGPRDAPAYTVTTRWYHLNTPSGACFTETVEAEGMRISTSLVTYTLAEEPLGTALTVDVTVSSFVGPEALGDHDDGWTSALARLAHLIENGSFAAVPA